MSSIPHLTLNFNDPAGAVQRLHEELKARLRERELLSDARVQIAIAGLSSNELRILASITDRPPGQLWAPRNVVMDMDNMVAYPRLLDKQLIVVAGQSEDGDPVFRATPLGRVVAASVKQLPTFKAPPQNEHPPDTSERPERAED